MSSIQVATHIQTLTDNFLTAIQGQGKLPNIQPKDVKKLESLENRIMQIFQDHIRIAANQNKLPSEYFYDIIHTKNIENLNTKFCHKQLNVISLSALKNVYDKLINDYSKKVRVLALAYFGSLYAHQEELTVYFKNVEAEYLQLKENLRQVAESLSSNRVLS